jgi:hypothetical protein
VLAPFRILIADIYRKGTPDLDKKVGETEAVIPERDHFSAPVRNDRINQCQWLLCMNKNDALRASDLRRRNPPAESIARPEIVKRIVQVVNQCIQSGRREVFDGGAAFPEDGITKEENLPCRHASYLSTVSDAKKIAYSPAEDKVFRDRTGLTYSLHMRNTLRGIG